MKPRAHHRIASLLMSAACLLAATAATAQTERRDELRRGVVKLVATSEDYMEETGSGVAVGSDERVVLILTAAHVVAGADTVEVTFYDKPYVKYPARIYERRHDDLDIAVVIAELGDDASLVDSLPMFAIGSNGHLEEGAGVTAIGHPLGTEWQQSPNTVASLNDQDDFRKFTFTNIRIDRGNSGGPILDDGDLLIGLVSRKAPIHTVGIKMKEVMAVLNEWRIPTNHLEMARLAGALKVDSQPIGAQVLLDDELVGATSVEPAVIEDVEPGRHRIEVRKTGYRPWKRSVRVEPGSEKEILAELEALPGTETATESNIVTLTEASVPTAPDETPELAAPLAPRAPESSINRPPVATPDGAVTDEDSPMIIDVLANDVDADGDPLRISEVDRRSEGGGAVASDGVLVTYIPAENFSGGDTFAYTVMDSDGEIDAATVTITVVPFNDDPVLEGPVELAVDEGSPLTASITASDPDGDPLTFTATGLPEGATLDPADGSLAYSPSYGVATDDSGAAFEATVTVDDGEGGSASQPVRISVTHIDGGVDPGDSVTVSPFDTAGASRPVELTFDSVSAAGIASVRSTTSSPQPPPLGQRVAGNTYFDVASSATIAGGIGFCVDPAPLRSDIGSATLQQLIPEGEDRCAEASGCWREITVAGQAEDATSLCGRSDRLGLVALFEPLAITAPPEVVRASSTLSVSAPLSDTGAVTAGTWNWGDGATTPAQVGVDQVTGTHSYGTPGVYGISLELLGGEEPIGSAEHAPVFVYRPGDEQVNAKGSFESPAGAYPGDPRAAGRAQFEFSSRYRSGGSAPDGKATFRFDAKSLRFKADSQEWLLVNKGLAILQGRGTIDRKGAFRFRFTVTDGETSGTGTDRVRVQIWNESTGGVVYDSQRGESGDAQPRTRLADGRIRIS
jgi:S1-C subfamily serine protease